MKKTTLLPLAALLVVAALLTAFTVHHKRQADSEVTFQDFIAQFPAQRLPYALDEKSLLANLELYVDEVNNRHNGTAARIRHRLDYEFNQFLPELDLESRFSRLPIQVEPIAVFTTAQHIAVLYGVSRGYGFQFAKYQITVFDHQGAFVSQNKIGAVSTDKLQSALIDQNLQASTRYWKINWSKDYDQTGVNNNRIKGLCALHTESFDLRVPTPKPSTRFGKELLVPTVEETDAIPVEGTRSK